MSPGIRVHNKTGSGMGRVTQFARLVCILNQIDKGNQHLISLIQKRGCLAEHLRWGDAFAVVYSVCDRRSFLAAAELLALLERTRLPGCTAVTLLGNKRDLEHARLV